MSSVWVLTRDGDPAGYRLYRRHYSSRKNPTPKQRQFVGPGEKMVLVTPAGDAVFAWRKCRFWHGGTQVGVNCAVFRNESSARSSDLILEAEVYAWCRWPGERLFTFVDGSQVKSTNPGFCFLMAGWRKCGKTVGGLLVYEKIPDELGGRAATDGG